MTSILCILESFLSLFAFIRLTGMTTTNPVTILLFFSFLYIYARFKDLLQTSKIVPGDHLHAGLLSIFFTASTLFVSYEKMTSTISSTLFCIMILSLSAIGLFLCFHHFLLWIYLKTYETSIHHAFYPMVALPYIAFVACLLCWLPYFLHEYPGIMTPDSINQFAQAVGIWELTNHHAVIHTLLIMFFYQIGLALTGNAAIGIACYTIFQMLFMAFVVGYVIRTLQMAKIKTSICVTVICFYALLPYHGILAVTMWKDVLFSGCMTLFVAALLRILLYDIHEKVKLSTILCVFLPYIIAGFYICLLRTNGFYAFIISIPFVLFTLREKIKLILPLEIIILVLSLFIRYPSMQIYQIKQPDFVESISIPAQQIARVIANGEALTTTQSEALSLYMDTSLVASSYNENVSDPIKNLIRQTGMDYIDTHRTEFLSLWLSIGLDHPKAYFDAFVAQTYGYWYPDAYSDIGLADGIYPNEFGLTWQPILKGSLIVKAKEIIFKLPQMFPLYGLLFSIGAAFWAILIAISICFRRHNGTMAILHILPVALVLTLTIATPVAVEFRYAYPLLFGLPLYLLAPFIKPN